MLTRAPALACPMYWEYGGRHFGTPSLCGNLNASSEGEGIGTATREYFRATHPSPLHLCEYTGPLPSIPASDGT